MYEAENELAKRKEKEVFEDKLKEVQSSVELRNQSERGSSTRCEKSAAEFWAIQCRQCVVKVLAERCQCVGRVVCSSVLVELCWAISWRHIFHPNAPVLPLPVS